LCRQTFQFAGEPAAQPDRPPTGAAGLLHRTGQVAGACGDEGLETVSLSADAVEASQHRLGFCGGVYGGRGSHQVSESTRARTLSSDVKDLERGFATAVGGERQGRSCGRPGALCPVGERVPDSWWECPYGNERGVPGVPSDVTPANRHRDRSVA
jgi:hypothetical protein